MLDAIAWRTGDLSRRIISRTRRLTSTVRQKTLRGLAAFALMLALPLLTTADDKAVKVKLGKLSAEAPTDWKSEKPANRLRSYQFKLPGEKGGPGDAELIVMPESDPKAEKVFPRWKSSFV